MPYSTEFKVRKAAKIRNRYNQVPHLTQDTTWESDKNTIKHHKQEPRGLKLSIRQNVSCLVSDFDQPIYPEIEHTCTTLSVDYIGEMISICFFSSRLWFSYVSILGGIQRTLKIQITENIFLVMRNVVSFSLPMRSPIFDCVQNDRLRHYDNKVAIYILCVRRVNGETVQMKVFL